MTAGRAAWRVVVVAFALAVSGCDLTPEQREASVRDEGVTQPWVIEKVKGGYGQGMLAALDNLHPLGSEFCIATRHYIPIAPHPLSPERKSEMYTTQAIALVPCHAVRADQFHNIRGEFSEVDILAALTAVETWARSGESALTGIKVEKPGAFDNEVAAYVKPEKFHGIFKDDDNSFADWPRGSIEIEFNADPYDRRIDPLTFSVKVTNGKVISIMTWHLYSSVPY